jgi:peptidoglycan/LPS O-acetylase OafA/YrhL
MVVVYHYVGLNQEDVWGAKNSAVFPAAHGAASYGWMGVYLFFLVSGFVICMSSWNRTPGQFITSRFVRLYPAYWVGVLLTSIVLYAAPGTSRLRPSIILTNLTMVQHGVGVENVDGVYWTLWAELRFYILFTLVIALGVTYRRVMAFCVVWMTVSVFAVDSHSKFLTAVTEPSFAPFFIGGVGIYLLYRFGPRPEIWLLIAASWLLGQHHMVSLAKDGASNTLSDVTWGWCVALVTLFYAVLIAVARGGLQFLNWRWLTVAGAMTYPLYLIHMEIGSTIITYTHDDVPAYLLVALLVVGMLLAAYLINRLIEEPVARRLKKWLAQPRKPAAGPRPVRGQAG